MMEDSAEESLDGSSIKPVSSLRSHFEQMANSRAAAAGSKPLQPQVTGSEMKNSGKDGPFTGPSRHGIANTGDTVRSGRSRERQEVITGLYPPRMGASSMSPSPTRTLRPRPASTLPPEVTVQPPLSPPKSKSLNLTLSSTPAYLAASSPLSNSPGSSSPRNFKIPSRPQTPLLEPGKSPRLPASQPPSPPPPRRSGELRREASFKNGPPPVNRAEKPRIAIKPLTLALNSEATKLKPGPVQPENEKSSPFSTPPSSGSSPEQELPPPSLPRNRPWSGSPGPSAQNQYEPPPMHYSVANKRRDHDMNVIVRNTVDPQDTEEQRPALPTRPQPSQDAAASRSMLPPPRPSGDKPRPAVITTDSTPFSTPPKRVFSTPTTQLQTPPRSHGRSMTVDRTSDRTPLEFRTPVATTAPSLPSRQPADTAPPLMKEASQSNSSEYPDSSHSNRRPPYLKQGVREIPTKYETRIMDVCGEYICTSGLITRIWRLSGGEMIASLVHTEGIKIMSVAFKPAPEVTSEGSRLWLGNNIGELIEIDVVSQSLTASNSNAHTRREIIKIYRHLDQMWTLDDGGTFHLWSPDSSGSIGLANPSQSFRVPKGHTFSMVVGDKLWHATGKDLRVFMPTIDGSTQFQVLQHPLYQSNAGEITSGANINSQPDKVYFGHTDGKISIYSRRDYSCLGIVNISVYKVTSLAGVGGNLWASFSTGMVYVYDVSQSPWVILKDWRAHQDPVIKLLVDPSSPWSLHRSQVITLGQDNMLRIWDGFLQDDWIETEMQAQEGDFCELETIKALVLTWNAGASTPYHLQQSEKDANFFRDLFRSSNCPDILIFGFQELVDLEDKKTVTKSFFKSKRKDPSEPEHMSHQYRDWRDFLTRCLDDYMPRDELYHLLHTASLVGLFTCIFVRAPLRERIRSICSSEVKRGMGGLHGNKGALIVRFILDDTSLCFINCHLAAGQTQTKDRNVDISMILESAVLTAERDPSVRQDSYVGGGDGTMILDHEICILNGDLNYRIDTMGRDTVVNAVKANNLTKLLERDQLLASRRKNPWFKLRAFHELPITFAPTYKYDVGTDNYDTSEKKRSPAWCDRVLYRGRDRIRQLDYRRHEVRVSDHRPVTASFHMVVKKISPKKRALKWDECKQQQLERNKKLINEDRHYYLTSILGFDSKTSKKMIQEKKG